MASKNLNRIKVVLADKQRTNKWLAEQLGKDKTTISKWCTNSSQPDLESLMKTAKQIQFVTFLILPNLNIPHLGYRLRIGNVPLSHLVVFPSSSVLATFNQNEESN